MKVLIVTGSVGTGKTTLARKLAKKFGFEYVDANKIIKKYNISEGYDRKRKTKIVDVNKLNKALIKEIGHYKSLIQVNNKKIPTMKSTIISFNNKKSNNKTFNKININKNKQKLIKENNKINNGIIIDSHLSHYFPKKYVDLCIVTKCNLKVLERRLKKRRYSKEKIRENLDTEIFDICLNEAKENGHKIIVIDTTKGIYSIGISKKIGGIIDSK